MRAVPHFQPDWKLHRAGGENIEVGVNIRELVTSVQLRIVHDVCVYYLVRGESSRELLDKEAESRDVLLFHRVYERTLPDPTRCRKTTRCDPHLHNVDFASS